MTERLDLVHEGILNRTACRRSAGWEPENKFAIGQESAYTGALPMRPLLLSRSNQEFTAMFGISPIQFLIILAVLGMVVVVPIVAVVVMVTVARKDKESETMVEPPRDERT